MAINEPTASMVGGVALLERALSYTCGALALVRPDLMGSPTPCRGWNLGQLLAHMNHSLATLEQAADGSRLGLADDDSVAARFATGRDPVAALRERGRRTLGAWANAAGSEPVMVGGAPLSAAIVATAGAIEVLAHGWDVGCACGCRRPVPDTLADELLDLAPLLVPVADRDGCFGPAVPSPVTATSSERLIAYLGRDPR